MNFAMKLHYQLLAAESDALPVLLIHGLFGNLDNTGVLARDLHKQHTVIKVDLRNHGLSPRADDMNYPAMAQIRWRCSTNCSWRKRSSSVIRWAAKRRWR